MKGNLMFKLKIILNVYYFNILNSNEISFVYILITLDQNHTKNKD